MGSSIEEQIDWLPLIPFSSNRSIIFYFISSKSKCNNLAKKLTRNLYFLCKIFNRMPPGASLQGDPISLSKNSVEMNPLKLERGSSRGRQPASSGIECPECLAWQGVQRAQRGLFGGKVSAFFSSLSPTGPRPPSGSPPKPGGPAPRPGGSAPGTGGCPGRARPAGRRGALSPAAPGGGCAAPAG